MASMVHRTLVFFFNELMKTSTTNLSVGSSESDGLKLARPACVCQCLRIPAKSSEQAIIIILYNRFSKMK